MSSGLSRGQTLPPAPCSNIHPAKYGWLQPYASHTTRHLYLWSPQPRCWLPQTRSPLSRRLARKQMHLHAFDECTH